MREAFPVVLVLTGLVGSGALAQAPDVPACCQGDARTAAILAAAHRASPGQPAAEKRETESQPALSTANWPAKPWPEGMVWIPTGEFTMGAVKGDTDAKPDESPAHRVRVTGFWMDQTEVTVGQFKAFVAATKYITIAERKPDWEEMKKQVPPGTPKPDDSLLVAGSMVFAPTEGAVPLQGPSCWMQWWSWVPGADWKHPLGPKDSIDNDTKHDNYPVVHVAWDDAVAYCKWAGKRLPTEAEWEFACRGGKEGERFIWGAEPPSATNIKANLWQGKFPYEKNAADGFMLAAPVRSFAPNGYGLYDMIGNVWEWCDDWYRPDTYAAAAERGMVVNPQGPTTSLDPTEPHMPKRVNRGGSFLCNAEYCASYRPSARMRTSPDTGQNHLGFRCVISQKAWEEKAGPKSAPNEKETVR